MNNKIKKQKREQGQSMVEMALISTVLILLLAGVLDFGRMYFTYLSLQNAAGEGAAYGSIFPERQFPPGHPTCSEPDIPDAFCQSGDPNNVVYRTQNESPSGLLDWSTTTVEVVTMDPPIAGTSITVTVGFDYDVITPVIEVIAGDTLTLRATAVNIIVGEYEFE